MAKPKIVFEDKTDSELPRIDKVKIAETEKGKTIQMSRNQYGFWEIQFKEGGELPEILKGTFTDYHFAQQAVAKYLEK